jgi:glycosyltransferase involved in cell wall biosynthesis
MITVLMATHNGARTLPIVLGAYCKLEPPAGGWKLVIVDNASTDSTRELVRSFQTQLPIAYVHEPRIGKNFALNTGLESITGDLVVLTDDDAVPQPDWLVQMRRVADTQPAFSVFGGATLPQWEAPPEDWIFDYLHPKYAITDPAWEEGPILPLRVYGPNMAIRAKVFEAGHRFDVNLGPRGSRYQQGDETEFLERIARSGFNSWHCKNAVVAHIIRKHQMTKEWLLRRAVPTGRAEFRRAFAEQDLPAALLGMPRYVIREILAQALRVGRVALSRNGNHILKERWRLNFLIGKALGGRDLYRMRGTRRAIR